MNESLELLKALKDQLYEPVKQLLHVVAEDDELYDDLATIFSKMHKSLMSKGFSHEESLILLNSNFSQIQKKVSKK